MAEDLIDLDAHRGSADQHATDIPRQPLFEILTHKEFQRRQIEELEQLLLTERADNWLEAAAKARYLIELFATTHEAQDPRHKQLIARALKDFSRLCRRDYRQS